MCTIRLHDVSVSIRGQTVGEGGRSRGGEQGWPASMYASLEGQSLTPDSRCGNAAALGFQQLTGHQKGQQDEARCATRSSEQPCADVGSSLAGCYDEACLAMSYLSSDAGSALCKLRQLDLQHLHRARMMSAVKSPASDDR